VHSELCACCHNVEDGQKGKQDAQIIFWKFPYIVFRRAQKMDRLKELISELFEIDLDCLHNIEVQDIEFEPMAKQEIDKTIGEMSSIESPVDIQRQFMPPKSGINCQGFWIESTTDLILYLWDGYQSRAILLGSHNWAIRSDITIH